MTEPLWRTVQWFLKKLNTELPYDPEIPLLGRYPEKIVVLKDTRTPVLSAALFTTARTCKQPRCHSPEEWVKMNKDKHIQWNIFSYKKEQNYIICRDMNGPRVCHRVKSGREKQISYINVSWGL